MEITEFRRDKKHCFRVELEDGRACFWDIDVCADYALRKGLRLTEEKIREISEQSEYTQAKSRALWYLDRASRTERGLFRKLLEVGFSPQASAAALARIKELGLIDDRRFAENAAERYARQNLSKREISRRLYEKGVPKEIISEVLENCEEQDENAKIRTLLERKYANQLDTPEEVRNVYAALARRGFSFGAVREELRKYSAELQEMSEE